MTPLNSEVVAMLTNQLGALRSLLREAVPHILEAWCRELVQECENMDDDRILDENVKSCCNLHAHLMLVYRNIAIEDLEYDSVTRVVNSCIYLTTRHSWNMGLLTIPETEVYELLTVQRRNLILWARSQPQGVFDEVMEALLRTTSGTGVRDRSMAPNGSSNGSHRVWGMVPGPRSVGRFAVGRLRHSTHTHEDAEADDQPVADIDERADTVGIELDWQAAQLTMRNAHLKALDVKIANRPDVVTVFGQQVMQASTVQSTEHREWYHLIGRNHDIQHWRTEDPRVCIQVYDREYNPGD
jgi:hypothetical protein